MTPRSGLEARKCIGSAHRKNPMDGLWGPTSASTLRKSCNAVWESASASAHRKALRHGGHRSIHTANSNLPGMVGLTIPRNGTQGPDSERLGIRDRYSRTQSNVTVCGNLQLGVHRHLGWKVLPTVWLLRFLGGFLRLLSPGFPYPLAILCSSCCFFHFFARGSVVGDSGKQRPGNGWRVYM